MAMIRKACRSRLVARAAAAVLFFGYASSAFAQKFCVLGPVPPLCHDEKGNVVPFDDPPPAADPLLPPRNPQPGGDVSPPPPAAVHGVSLAVTLAFANGKDCDSKLGALKAQADWVSASSSESDAILDVGRYCKALYPLGDGQKIDLRSMFSVGYSFADHDDCVNKISATEADAIEVQQVKDDALEDIGGADAFCGAIVPKTAPPGSARDPKSGEGVGGAGPSHPCPGGSWGIANPECGISW